MSLEQEFEDQVALLVKETLNAQGQELHLEPEKDGHYLAVSIEDPESLTDNAPTNAVALGSYFYNKNIGELHVNWMITLSEERKPVNLNAGNADDSVDDNDYLNVELGVSLLSPFLEKIRA